MHTYIYCGYAVLAYCRASKRSNLSSQFTGGRCCRNRSCHGVFPLFVLVIFFSRQNKVVLQQMFVHRYLCTVVCTSHNTYIHTYDIVHYVRIPHLTNTVLPCIFPFECMYVSALSHTVRRELEYVCMYICPISSISYI